MSTSKIVIALAALAIAAPGIAVEKAAPSRPASISFVSSNLRNWTAVGDRTIYLQDTRGDWYRAELSGPSPDLPFVQAIGFKADITDTLDSWGAVYIRGIRYDFKSFEKADGPPPDFKAKAKAAKPEPAPKG
jgi:hypothetical protein